MTERYEFDHVSIAVRDPHAAIATVRAELGATPLLGGILPEFRYVLTHVGSTEHGARLELISPAEPVSGFIHRFLHKHGEAPHHLSFCVPDIYSVREKLHTAGFITVQEDLDYPRWREFFLPPDELHGLVIQVASSGVGFPSLAETFASRERDFASMPNNRGATSPDWWADMWEVPVENHAVLGATVLASTDMARTETLFGEILHGERLELHDCWSPALNRTFAKKKDASQHLRAVFYRWPTGTILVQPAPVAGVQHVLLDRSSIPRVRVGSVDLILPEQSSD